MTIKVHTLRYISPRQKQVERLQLRRNIVYDIHFLMSKGVSFLMNLLMVIFGLVAILAVVGTFQAIKEKNLLSIVFNLASAGVFGWFVIMTIIHSGYPPVLH